MFRVDSSRLELVRLGPTAPSRMMEVSLALAMYTTTSWTCTDHQCSRQEGDLSVVPQGQLQVRTQMSAARSTGLRHELI